MEQQDEFVVVSRRELEALRERERFAFRQFDDPVTSLGRKSAVEQHLHFVTIGIFFDEYNVLTTREAISNELLRQIQGNYAPIAFEKAINKMSREAPAAVTGLGKHIDSAIARDAERVSAAEEERRHTGYAGLDEILRKANGDDSKGTEE